MYRLGAPIYFSAGLCPACKKDSDRYGDHAIVCARPADVFIPSWTGGSYTALDGTVVSPLLIERVDLSISAPGHTLEVAFRDKCRDYLNH